MYRTQGEVPEDRKVMRKVQRQEAKIASDVEGYWTIWTVIFGLIMSCCLAPVVHSIVDPKFSGYWAVPIAVFFGIMVCIGLSRIRANAKILENFFAQGGDLP